MAAGSPRSMAAAAANISPSQAGPVKQAAAVTAPTGGATVDAECRAQLSALLVALRASGALAS